jgi:nitrogen regulatory protein PII
MFMTVFPPRLLSKKIAMKKYWVFMSIVVCLCACNRVEKRYVVKVKPVKLQQETLYDNETVYNAVFDAEESGSDSLKTEARKHFLKAIDLYRNKNNVRAAIAEFKRSLIISPEAKTYYELGNALVDIEDPDEALKAYDVAEYLNFRPASMLYYKIACAKSIADEENEDGEGNDYKMKHVVRCLERAFETGFADTALIQHEKKLALVLQSPEYRELMVRLAAKNSVGNNNQLFNVFVQAFPVINNSFEIPKYDVAMKQYKTSISYDFAPFIPEMENVGFGRDVSHDFFIVGKLAETPQYVVLVYTSVSFMDEDMQPVLTRIVTYSKEGKAISSKIFSSQFSAEKIRVGKYANGEFTVEDYNRTWEKPIDKVPFEDNQVKNYQLIANATFTIEADGKILAKEISKNYKETASGTKN